MKKLFILFTFLMTVVVVSCQNQQDDLETERLQNIAQSQFYQSYLSKVRAIQLGVAKGNFDLLAVTTVLKKYPSMSICEISAAEFEQIQGGEEYKGLLCALEKASAELRDNVPDYFKLNKDQLYRITQLHDVKAGINWSKTIENAINH